MVFWRKLRAFVPLTAFSLAWPAKVIDDFAFLGPTYRKNRIDSERQAWDLF
jgi:hypothetical protein